MYDMLKAKVDCLARKLNLDQKNPENDQKIWTTFGIFSLRKVFNAKLSRPKKHSKISNFDFFLHEITLYALDKHNIGRVAPFLPLQDHFEVRFFPD